MQTHYPCAPKKVILTVDFTSEQHQVEFYKFNGDKEPHLSLQLPYRTLGRITKYISCRRKVLGEDIKSAPTGLTVTYYLA